LGEVGIEVGNSKPSLEDDLKQLTDEQLSETRAQVVHRMDSVSLSYKSYREAMNEVGQEWLDAIDKEIERRAGEKG
jgi:hypothetical protein